YISIRHADALFLFFTVTPTIDILTLSLHDALPISCGNGWAAVYAFIGDKPAFAGLVFAIRPWQMAIPVLRAIERRIASGAADLSDRKSTRLNSSHGSISYAVFCLKKKRTQCPGRCRSQQEKETQGWCPTTVRRLRSATASRRSAEYQE